MNIYKLSNIVQIVEKGFKQLFWDFDFWVEAEVSTIKEIKNKIYIDFVEFSTSWEVLSKAKWIMFDIYLWKNFQKIVWISSLEDLKWNKILVLCRLNFHIEYGFSLIINDISSEYSIGQFQKNLQFIKNQLLQLGVYDNNKNLPLPILPFNIAIISSQNSQWLTDFLTILNKSWYRYSYELYDTPIHWNDAKEKVYESLRQIYSDSKNWKKIDFVAIIRWWWGSSWIVWQNDFNIAKAICMINIPVIIAVWHTSDRYILDDIAKISAKTPSDAAYLLIQIIENYVIELKDLYSCINIEIGRKIGYYRFELDSIKETLNTIFPYIIRNLRDDIDNMNSFILSFSPERLVQKWYWVLKDINWDYLSKEQVEKYNKTDKFWVDIYDNEFLVEIVEKKNK